MECCIIIPAYQPNESFVTYVRQLRAVHSWPVLVIDDGSAPDCTPLFEQVREIKGCVVLHHAVNRGKGAALKTAFAYYKQHKAGAYAGCCGVVTADCDGQHTLTDVEKTALAMVHSPNALTLGCRAFDADTPPRSMLGNRLISSALRALYDIKLPDSQTGLRGVPNTLIDGMAALDGDRYEYELNMLLWAKSSGALYNIVPIQTVYLNNNEGSHYRVIADSLRILSQLLQGLGQYILASVLSGAVDVVLYALLIAFAFSSWPSMQRILCAAVMARVVSSLVNYGCNRRLSYMQNKKVSTTLVRYYILWAGQLAVSFGLTWFLSVNAGMNEIAGKYMIDLLLALISYQIQLRWVFAAGENGATRHAWV